MLVRTNPAMFNGITVESSALSGVCVPGLTYSLKFIFGVLLHSCIWSDFYSRCRCRRHHSESRGRLGESHLYLYLEEELERRSIAMQFLLDILHCTMNFIYMFIKCAYHVMLSFSCLPFAFNGLSRTESHSSFRDGITVWVCRFQRWVCMTMKW